MKTYNRELLVFLWILLFLIPTFVSAQVAEGKVQAPVIRDFAPALQFLASPALEGRETGTQSSYIAADYIASEMQKMGLIPYRKVTDETKADLSDYFQTFTLLRYSIGEVSVAIHSLAGKSKPVHLMNGKDFTLENAFGALMFESPMVFAGYGINSPELNYNDYAGHDAHGKLVILFDGYPGQHDTLNIAWKKFRTLAENDGYDLDMKCMEAARQGASAIIVINKEYYQATAYTEKAQELFYQDSEYVLPATKPLQTVPCFMLTTAGSRQLSEALNLNFREIEREIARQVNYPSLPGKDLFQINLQIDVDTLIVHNVVGILPGSDTTKTIILGAHYDHLGKRGNDIYVGSDDNASGVAGLLALAEMWTGSHTTPPCNIMFASWTAEEKGLIGSEYFASQLKNPEKVKLYVNMDMISRSVKEDTAGRQLSIGTRTADEYLRELACRSNSKLKHTFTLDLWDVTGHSGSDYASFTAKNIPVMTYNTGLHDDYHTPRDIPASADLVKMGEVLKLINTSLQEVLESTK